ncbi:MAG: transposase zinc-binding domain-containing protein [Candidatus Aminicenantes bacterium]|nr:transposase zinc-binding domain-containing protein [Candidatus Aminicenantes bacterium]
MLTSSSLLPSTPVNPLKERGGFLRPIIKDVVGRYLDCGNPRCGFARIRFPSCGEERLLYFSCRTRGFCPSCHSKRREECGSIRRPEPTKNHS